MTVSEQGVGSARPGEPDAAGTDGHRDAIDVARVLALLLVVVGHLTLAVVDRDDDGVRGANLLELHPGWAFATVLAPMPVFFAAAGWANVHATAVSAGPRLRSLVGAAAAVVVTWSVGVVVADVVAGHPGIVADGARVATQPVWFLAAYVPFVASGHLLYSLVARRPVAVIGGCLAVLALLDVARFGFGAPDWIGWPGFFVAWGVPWLIGAWWRHRARSASFCERCTGVVIALAGIGTSVLLVHLGGYSPALIDAVDGARSNTTPPTLYTATAGIAQVGVLLVGAGLLDAVGRRWRTLWDRAGAAAVGVYLWHLTALALCAGVIALGLPVPDRLSAPWWWTRPVWWVAVIGVASCVVAVSAVVRERIGRRWPPPAAPSRPWVLAGVALATVAAGLVGLRGPRTVALAAVCSGLFVAAWAVLGGRRAMTRCAGAGP